MWLKHLIHLLSIIYNYHAHNSIPHFFIANFSGDLSCPPPFLLLPPHHKGTQQFRMRKNRAKRFFRNNRTRTTENIVVI